MSAQPGGPGAGQTPGSMLEIYMKAVDSKTGDAFLDRVNLGVGNYSDPEYWQQIQAFRDGLFADAAMTEKIIERAKLQTQMRMVDAIFDEPDARVLDGVDHPEVPRYDEDGEEAGVSEGDPRMTRRQYFDRHIEDIWQDLGKEGYTASEHKAWLVHTVTGLDMDWTPPHWRMLKARHEASRSKAARLIDNLFGRPPEPDPQPMEDFS